MEIRVGTDIVHIPRVSSLLSDETALERIFTRSELKDRDPSHLAGILAAKESVFKAMDVRPCWLDIEIGSSESGRPAARLSGKLAGAAMIGLSISHDGDYAVAIALVRG